MNPTSEQQTILTAARDTTFNLTINALAGCGKTTTVRMIERAVPTKPILVMAFNKAVAKGIEFDSKSPTDPKRMTSTTTVRTFNSIGHRMWSQYVNGNLTLDPKKTQTILREVIKELPAKSQGPLWEVYWEVINGVGFAKALGYVPQGKFPNAQPLINQSGLLARLDERPDDLTADLIDVVLTRSITASFKRVIDYNDQVYMPSLFGANYPRFPLVMVDEAQDLNPVNHEMLRRLCKTSRIILVGDPYQSVYGFRGAVQSGMQELSHGFSTSPLDLSTSFRCPSVIVENARWRVPHYQWIREGGRVEHLQQLDLTSLPEAAAFICRNNAPLLSLAFRLLSNGRSVSVAGSDIGPKLIGILRRFGDESLPRSAVLSAIDDWTAEREAKGSASAADMGACMRVFAEHGADLGQATRYAEHIFAQKGSIRLLTGHKAKGLEFPTVYFLDPHLCREDEQDLNLKYVIETRAMENLYYINSTGIV